MIDAMVYKKLLATSAVTALVSTRIYIDEQPDPATLPSITVHPTSGVPNAEIGKKHFARVQVSCWAEPGKPKNPKTVESVAAAVRAALHKPIMNLLYPESWTAGTATYTITKCICTGGIRLIDPTTGWYHIPVDVEISYNEA